MGETGVKTLMIAGGGTGGHIYPAIAIAREYVARDASRKVVFVGTQRGLEKTIVPKAGFPLEFIDVGGLKGKGGLDLLRNVARLPLGFVQAWQHRRQVIARTSSSASAAIRPARCSSRRRCAAFRRSSTRPTPSPASPTASLARWTTAVAVAFAEALPRMKRKDGVVTGNPDPQRVLRPRRNAATTETATGNAC